MFTVITKGNEVRQYPDINSIERSVDGPFLAINSCSGSKVAFTEDDPITWPADATSGLQAIVDVKAGTLRFCHDELIGLTEYMVSEYVAPAKKGLHSETTVVEWPEDAPAGLLLVHNLVTLECKFEAPKYELKENEIVAAVKGMEFVPFVSVEDSDLPTPITAASMLTAALGHMEDRAKTYDAPGGERSMGKTVDAFNVITGLELTEEQGWLFMEILKQVRSQQGNYRADNYEDMVAYAALRGECAARERGKKS